MMSKCFVGAIYHYCYRSRTSPAPHLILPQAKLQSTSGRHLFEQKLRKYGGLCCVVHPLSKASLIPHNMHTDIKMC